MLLSMFLHIFFFKIEPELSTVDFFQFIVDTQRNLIMEDAQNS